MVEAQRVRSGTCRKRRRSSAGVVHACVIVLAWCLSAPAPAALPGVVELKTTPEQITDGQLATLLDSRIASVDVVALGESVHGSSGFLRIQARLIRFLVEKHGFRLILWENPPLRSLELARWLASCRTAGGSPPLDVLYMPTQSDLPLFEWLCRFNRSQPHDPVAFRGVDVWDRPWEHYRQIAALSGGVGVDAHIVRTIESSCPASRASSWTEVEAARGRLQSGGRVFPEDAYERCRAALTVLLEKARRAGLQRREAKDRGADVAFELAISASTLLGWLGFYHEYWASDIASWNARDQAQGRNIMLLMEKHAVARAVVSAHTSHVSHNRSPADWWGFGDIKSGVHFFETFTRKRVFNVALTAYDASGTQGHWLAPTAAHSLDKRLHDAGHAFAFFPSDAPFLGEHPRWWLQNQNAGAFENGVEIVPRDHFDAFIFFARTHVDKALPARPMWEP